MNDFFIYLFIYLFTYSFIYFVIYLSESNFVSFVIVMVVPSKRLPSTLSYLHDHKRNKIFINLFSYLIYLLQHNL